jgi:hypothetical protein
MKGLIIGLIVGAVVVWGWYKTDKGKISITETVTVTNTVVKTVEERRYVDQLRWIDKYQTNIVWVTNYVERMREPVVVANPAPTSEVKIPSQYRSEAVGKPSVVARQPSRFGGPIAISNAPVKYNDGKKVIGHTGVHKGLGE